MFIIVVGGGKVGYYLIKDLLEAGQEASIVEKDKLKADNLTEILGGIVIYGDGCDPLIMEKAGVERADMIVAVTGDDEDNLVICQIAKNKFNVPFVMAKVNNPKNETTFKMLGIDETISSTNIILSLIEQEVAYKGILTSLPICRRAGVKIIEAMVKADSPLNKKSIKNLNLPPNTLITGVVRNDEWIVPDGNFVVEVDDMLIFTIKEENFENLKKVLLAHV